MIKMYNAEVLSKFPVVQHFYFGSLFSWEQDPNATPPPASVHASSQPIRDGPALSLENSSARTQPQEGTKAPWANKPTGMPKPGVGIAAPWANKATGAPSNRGGMMAPWANRPTGTPNPGTGTAAPWANKPNHLGTLDAVSLDNKSAAATNAGPPPTTTPQPTLRGLPSTIVLPLRSADSVSDAGAMPPPAKAPWAK